MPPKKKAATKKETKAPAPKKVIEKKKPAAAASKAKAPAAKKTPAKKAPAAKKPAAKKGKKKVVEEEEEEDLMEIEEESVIPAPKKKTVNKGGSVSVAGKVVRVVDSRCTVSGSVHEDFDVMLNQTNIDNNNNKFYVIQLVQSSGQYFCWNRWGRVGEPGQNALKGPMDLAGAKKEFEKKFKDKTGNAWASRDKFESRAGKYSLVKLKTQVAPTPTSSSSSAKGKGKGKAAAEEVGPSKLSKEMQEFVRYIFNEAKNNLTKNLDANITDNGIETPLGVLSLEQVEEGESILDEAFEVFNSKTKLERLKGLSSRYYTAIPHRFGRTVPPVINTHDMFNTEYELLALMKDMVKIGNKSAGVLNRDNPDKQLESLGCDITRVAPASAEFKKVCAEIVESQKRSHGSVHVKVVNVFKVRREEEHARFTKKVSNVQTLYHGSRIANWVGLLSRGILMPKIVVALGVHRTDPGWLGNGIYFGNADTAAGYAGQGAKGTAFMLMLSVALGKMKDYSKITYGLTAPPKGFDSCHGVMGTEFYDDEFVVYEENQQKIEYLVEIGH